MAKLKFTVAALRDYFDGTRGERVPPIVWDTETRGLGAYRTGSGGITLFAQYRIANGKQRKKTLGRLGELLLSDARAKASEYAIAGRHGTDLVAQQKEMVKPKFTLGEAFLAYNDALKRRGVSANTLRLNGHNWSRHISEYQARDIASITKQDVRAWHTKWGNRGPTVANQCARLLRAIYNYAAKCADDPPPNPCSAVEYFPERNLRRSIPTKELAVWWQAVEKMPNPIRRAYWKTLLLTGLRRMDAATMRWDEVFETHIHRPNPKGGRTKAFDLPLTEALKGILAEAKAARDILFPNSPYVFPAESKSGHLETAQEAKFLPGCAPHDMRRTYATACMEAGVDPYVIKQLLNHAADKNDVTARYVRVSEDIKKQGAQIVADFILRNLKLKNCDNVEVSV